MASQLVSQKTCRVPSQTRLLVKMTLHKFKAISLSTSTIHQELGKILGIDIKVTTIW